MDEGPTTVREKISAWFGCPSEGPVSCVWRCVLDFAVVLWIVRVPSGIVVLGYILLGETPQAQDLMIPLAESGPLRILWFFILHFVLWAMPTHYSARLLLDDDWRFGALLQRRGSGYLSWLERWVPRILGVAPFGAIIMSAARAEINLPILPDDPNFTASITAHLHHLMIWAAVSILAFLTYAIWRPALADTPLFRRAEAKARIVYGTFKHLEIAPGAARTADPNRPDHSAFGRLLLIAEFVLFVAVLLLDASAVAECMPRAFAIALVLGGWLPILTYLSAIGRRLQAPLIVSSFLLIAVITVIVGDNHDVRRLDAAVAKGGSRIALQDAVRLWMAENHCSGADCPRPVIIAAAGGASRAGFFVASVVGHLLDRAKDHRLDETEVRRRLFAFSGVSGGSVGAVMVTAAFAAAGKRTEFPCPKTPFALWYGNKIENWRGCLEALMAGDFLTPTFIGLAFQDMVPFGHRSDRATMLEIALERRFAAITGLNGIDPKSRPCSSDLLNCPFLTLIPRPGLWVPLLVLNGLSVGTGQRLVTTSLEPTYIAARCAGLGSPAACRLFTDTFHFHDLLHEAAPGGDWKASLQRSLTADQLLGRKAVDVRLSTAALNSARFPIISPPGGIRNESNHMVDRVVDGGYFENYGVATAVELAKAMRAVEPAIAPFVLVISNDPGFPIDSQQMPENIQDTDFLTDATALFYSVLRARDARGKLGVAQLRSELREVEAACGSSSAHLRVWPQDASSSRPSCSKHSGTTRAVSMSWWLSTPIQLHLVEQIDGKDNCNKDAVSTLWQALEAPACGTKLLQINAILRDQLP